jgi:nucleotide-binding universal stress UspA family protein
MRTVLVAVDGSDSALRAVAHVMALERLLPELEIHLLNVQIPVVSGVVKMFVNKDQIDNYYREEGAKALEAARRKLDQAGVAYSHHIMVGHLAETIVEYAKQKACNQIVMGTRGMSAVSSLVLGSVASRVIHVSDVPVTLVK